MEENKLAVLIDADNMSPNILKEFFEEIAKYGTASIKRAYGDWSSDTLNGWKEKLLEFAIIPVHHYANIKTKNATDICMIIDAMDLLYSNVFNGFVIASSDSDFTRLASRIRAEGLTVYGFGRKNTPKSLIASCDKFINTDTLTVKKSKTSNGNKKEISHDYSLIINAINALTEENDWVNLGVLGKYLTQIQPDFTPKSYGFSNLSKLLESIKSIKLKRETGGAYPQIP